MALARWISSASAALSPAASRGETATVATEESDRPSTGAATATSAVLEGTWARAA
jgi:hypothetical protein